MICRAVNDREYMLHGSVHGVQMAWTWCQWDLYAAFRDANSPPAMLIVYTWSEWLEAINSCFAAMLKRNALLDLNTQRPPSEWSGGPADTKVYYWRGRKCVLVERMRRCACGAEAPESPRCASGTEVRVWLWRGLDIWETGTLQWPTMTYNDLQWKSMLIHCIVHCFLLF